METIDISMFGFGFDGLPLLTLQKLPLFGAHSIRSPNNFSFFFFLPFYSEQNE